MAYAPRPQILYRRNGDIFFGWAPLSRTEAKSYNLYSSATSAGVYSFLSSIPNIIDKNYQNKVCVLIKDAEIPIPANVKYYFKLTYIDLSNVESNINLSAIIAVYPFGVNPNYEGEQRDLNSHIFAWEETDQHWEKLLINSEGRLKADVVIDPLSINRINDYEEALNIAPGVETEILSYTNAQSYYLEKIACSSTADALFKLKINGLTINTLRNSWANRNIFFDYSDKSFYCAPATIVSIAVYHTEVNNQNYETSLFGYITTF